MENHSGLAQALANRLQKWPACPPDVGVEGIADRLGQFARLLPPDLRLLFLKVALNAVPTTGALE